MRVLRSSMYPSPYGKPLTVVMREQDLSMPIEEATLQYGDGAFTVEVIFEMEDGDIKEATFEAMKRRDDEQEKHQAMLYYHNAQTLKIVTAGGAVMGTKPTPLSVDEITEVFKQLTRHPDYKHHRMTTISRDFQVVTMKDGDVLVGQN